MVFQSTLPRRERPAAATGGGTGGRNFNPRSREGSDVAHHVHRLDGLDISIHAPAKGATRQVCTLRHQFDISIHAPAKGATFRRTCTCGQLYAFQSTLPRRERRSAGLAPAFSSMHFNPRSREGSDVAGRPIAASEPFQSTLPRRERRASSAVMGKAAAFQSTLPRRERPDR